MNGLTADIGVSGRVEGLNPGVTKLMQCCLGFTTFVILWAHLSWEKNIEKYDSLLGVGSIERDAAKLDGGASVFG